MKTIALLSVAVIFTSFSAHAQTNGQNFYTPNANPPATPGLTNPSGSTVYTPNSPPHPLGGSALTPNTSNNINITNGPIPDNTTSSLSNINTTGPNGTGTGVTTGTGTGAGTSASTGVR